MIRSEVPPKKVEKFTEIILPSREPCPIVSKYRFHMGQLEYSPSGTESWYRWMNYSDTNALRDLFSKPTYLQEIDE